LRGFDQQMAEEIVSYMALHGTKFIRPGIPIKIEKLSSDGKLKVIWKNIDTGQQSEELFDTVMLAVGRKPETDKLGLESAGVIFDKQDGKIPVHNERSSCPHIYAIGDVIKGELELTPVAIRAGRLLARRFYNDGKVLMDYVNVPTTVFTPLEYGCCGLTEEKAIALLGNDNIEVYHSNYTPLEYTVAERGDNTCYCKVICNKKDNERIIGIHILGPHAGDVIQGFAVSIKCGVTKQQLDYTIGIHPTTAEELLTLTITKRSGAPTKKRMLRLNFAALF